MNQKDFEIYKEGYMLGVRETLEMVFKFLKDNNIVVPDECNFRSLEDIE